MKKNITYFAIVTLLLGAIFVSINYFMPRFTTETDEYKKFQLIKYNDLAEEKSKLYKNEGEPPPELGEKIKFVLKFYDVPFVEKNGAVFVGNKTFADQDYMANLTTKILDEGWLKEKGFPSK